MDTMHAVGGLDWAERSTGLVFIRVTSTLHGLQNAGLLAPGLAAGQEEYKQLNIP